MDALMKRDCDVYARDFNGFTGLDYVFKEDHVKCVRYVLSETLHLKLGIGEIGEN